MENVFREIKGLLKTYEPPFTRQGGKAANTPKPQFNLWTGKKALVAGRRHDTMFFAGTIRQKHYVGFYFMPVYIETGMKKVLAPELVKLLKGKSCFHIKKLDPKLKAQIKDALDKGEMLYRKRGWI